MQVPNFSVAALIATIQLLAVVLAAELFSTQLLRMSTIIGRLPSLSGVDIILASKSPQRKQILKNVGGLGAQVRVIPSTFDESLDQNSFASAGEYAIATARGKAEQVVELLLSASSEAQEQQQKPEKKRQLIIGSDTVVVSPTGKVLEKPVDGNDAAVMLQSLSGKWHSVFSGVALYTSRFGVNPVVSFFEETKVKFAELSDEDITRYISTGEPLNKAGAYGIQGMGAHFLECINGDYYNVMGFPLHRFSREVVRLLENGAL